MNLKIFSSKKVPLSNVDMKILKELYGGEGFTQKELNKRTKTSISGISKSLKRLCKFGFLYILPHPIKIYRPIPERKEEVKRLITGYDFGKNSSVIIDAHAYTLECELKSLPEKFLKRLLEHEHWIEFMPKSWKGCKKSYLDGSVKFHKTKKGCSAFFYFRTFACDAATAELINIQKFLDKKSLLEDKYPGLKIGNYDIIAECPYQEVAILFDPESVESIKLGFKHKNIEDSHRIGGEWEEKGPDASNSIRKIIKLREIVRELDSKSIKRLINFARELKNANTNG